MELVKFLKSAFILLTLLGIAVWAGIVWKAESAEELKEACYPLEWATDGIHDVIAALTGMEPTWTRQAQMKLMNGCYFFVWRLSQVDSAETTAEGEPAGGIRK